MSSSPRYRATALAGLLLLGACRQGGAAPAVGTVGANGVTLTSVSLALPSDDRDFPEAPGADTVRQNCTACHSSAMILSQPPLKREQWQAEVEKMQKAYHAPVDAKAVPAIVDYLEALQSSPGRGGGPRP